MLHELILDELEKMRELAATCQETAIALIETNLPWFKNSLSSRIWPTDYERARKDMMKLYDHIQYKLDDLRRQSVNPAAIRTIAYLGKLEECCLICPHINQKASKKKAFHCLLLEILTEEQDQAIE